MSHAAPAEPSSGNFFLDNAALTATIVTIALAVGFIWACAREYHGPAHGGAHGAHGAASGAVAASAAPAAAPGSAAPAAAPAKH